MKNCHLHLSNGTRSLYGAALHPAQKIVKVPPIYQRTATCTMIDARNLSAERKTLSGTAQRFLPFFRPFGQSPGYLHHLTLKYKTI
jgi:hypothetical protein